MKFFPAGMLVLGLGAATLSGCRRHVEAAKADLGEAGYKFTPEDWFRAAGGNDVVALKKFVAAGFPAGSRNPESNLALHVAAGAGADAAAEFLLDRKQEVDARGAAGRTPLMAAVIGDHAEMVRWLLRQGADAKLKDDEGFRPLMLAVREGSAGAVAELAAHDREDLDAALLLAAMMDKGPMIDVLTSFGASVHARMDDGRTPLMVAAQNGNMEAAKMLLDVGASRLAIDADGRTAADMALAAGHPEVAALISRDPLPADLAFESPAAIAGDMERFVDRQQPAATAGVKETGGGVKSVSNRNSGSPSNKAAAGNAPSNNTVSNNPSARRGPAVALEGQMLGETASTPAQVTRTRTVATGKTAADKDFALAEMVMRHYREKEVPVSVKSVQGDTATLVLTGATTREVKVRTGDTIPGSNLTVVRVRRRMEDSKDNLGKPTEISVIDVQDRSTGISREWIAGIPAKAHDPLALVEDGSTGKRYIAAAGQRFHGPDGAEYIVSDVRPNQMVIRESATGEATTIPLRGPRG